jgi:hypothetical protein
MRVEQDKKHFNSSVRIVLQIHWLSVATMTKRLTNGTFLILMETRVHMFTVSGHFLRATPNMRIADPIASPNNDKQRLIYERIDPTYLYYCCCCRVVSWLLGPGIICTKNLRNMHAFMRWSSFKYALKTCKNMRKYANKNACLLFIKFI